MITKQLIKQIDQAARACVLEAGRDWPEGLAVLVERTTHMEHGDYATNIAMQLARVLRQSPIEIAKTIQIRLEQSDSSQLLRKTEVAPPGFLNLYLDWNKWAQLDRPLADPIEASRPKIVIEHTSINPNKSAHIGHLRNSCLGDTLARMLRRAGYSIEVHNYIDDLGNQLADSVVGLLHTELEMPHNRLGDFCWDVYAQINREYEQNSDLLQERTRVLQALEAGNNRLAWLGLLVAERIVREHVDEMKPFGIHYDVLVWESSIVRGGFWASAFEQLRRTPVFQLETTGKLAGCWVLKQEADTPEEDQSDSDFQSDKVLVRSNGVLTYTAKDIAYHLWKFGLLDTDFRYRKFADHLWTTDMIGTKKPFGKADQVINVIDRRQEYPQALVKQALHSLGYTEEASKLRHVSYGVVSLSPMTAEAMGIDTSAGKAAYAMSGRQGIGIKISEMLDGMERIIDEKRSRKSGLPSQSIAAAAIRYYLLRYHLQTDIVFDMQQATEVSGNTGVYLLYSHARAASILKRAKSEYGIRPERPEPLPAFGNEEYALLRQLACWPELLETAAEELAPHLICNYAHELSTLFNHFYTACPILKAEAEQRAFRLWLTSLVQHTLADALDVLGLPAPNRM